MVDDPLPQEDEEGKQTFFQSAMLVVNQPPIILTPGSSKSDILHISQICMSSKWPFLE
jgi:hypothetical protein